MGGPAAVTSTDLESEVQVTRLVTATRDLLRSLAEPSLQPFLDDWPEYSLPTRPVEPNSLPIVQWLAGVARHDVPQTRPLVELIAEFSGRLTWGKTYGEEDFGAEFLERYGWSEFIGRRGPVASERLACGVLVLGPHTKYPEHRHEAEEVYVPLSGTAHWWKDRDLCASRAPGSTIHHPPWLSHAMETAEEPLIALYLWRAGDLTQRSLIC